MSAFRIESTQAAPGCCILVRFAPPSRSAYFYLRFLGFVLLLITAFEEGLALDPNRAISQYVHDVWQSEDGLPQNSVESMAQTNDGYLWLGTLEGLVRFDGLRFTVFDKDNTKGINNNWIHVLCEDREGTLWIGTDGGLTRLQGGEFETFTVEDGLIHERIRSIYQDRNGRIWIGTEGGLSRFDQGKFTSFAAPNRLSHPSVYSIHEDRQGNLWLGTGGGGLNRFQDGKFSVYTTQDGLSHNFIRAIHEDVQGNLWLGTDGGLTRITNGTSVVYTTQNGLSHNVIRFLCEDQQGNLWIATYGGGLNRFYKEQFSSLGYKDGLSTDMSWSILEDKEGSLWVGTDGGGLDRFRDGKFLNYGRTEGLTNDFVRSILEDRAGGLWIGTYGGGLNFLNQGKWNTYTTSEGLTNNHVWALHQDHDGTLWIGTSNGGLCRLRDGRITRYTVSDGLSNDRVRCIYEDRKHNLWIGTYGGGLNKFDRGRFVHFTTKEGLSHNFIYAIEEDPNGNLWIATHGGGLNRLSDGVITAYRKNDGLASDNLLSLYWAVEGDLWIGTIGGGLSRYNGGKFWNYTKKDGLFDDTIFRILEDDRGNLWMTSNKGIFRVSKKEMRDFDEGRIRSLKCISYGLSDGMKINECNGGWPAGWKTRNGWLWFPTLKGVAAIDPENIKQNTIPPKVHIETMVVDSQSIRNRSSAQIILEPGKKNLEFHYTALSYLAPEKVLFRYRLGGYDTDWVNAETRRVAYYTNIAPGNYRFQVIACNNDGVWNETGDQIAFELRPYFYQTKWFYLFCASVLAALAAAGHRYRLRRMKVKFSAVLAERTRIARELHDTLAQNLSGVVFQLRSGEALCATDPERSRYHYSRAMEQARESMNEAREAVWRLRPEYLESGIPQALNHIASQFTERSDVRIQVHVNGTPRRLKPEVEEQIIRIAQEAMTNAVKHSGASCIQVDLRFDPRNVELCVRDDGAGFDVHTAPSLTGSRFGIKGMKERAREIGAHFVLQSQPGKGTEVLIRHPK